MLLSSSSLRIFSVVFISTAFSFLASVTAISSPFRLRPLRPGFDFTYSIMVSFSLTTESTLEFGSSAFSTLFL